MRQFTAFLFVFILIAVDQTIKYAIAAKMALGHYIEILPFFALYHVRNNGIAFSMLSSFNDWGLIGFTLVIIAFIIALWWPLRHGAFLSHCGYLMVLGGAFGNLIDRLRFHYVTDYILFFYQGWSFAVFNLADSFITLGAILIIGRELFIKRSQKQNQA